MECELPESGCRLWEGRHSHLERHWMGLHWSPPLDGQRGTSQQLGPANVQMVVFLWKSGPQNTEVLDRPAGKEVFSCLQRCKEGKELLQVLVASQAPRPLVPASSLQQGLWVLCPLCSACLCLPQATYVLLALAWVFVPIYVSSEVSLLLGTQGSLTRVWALV